MKTARTILMFATIVMLAGHAVADWDPVWNSDGTKIINHKMHYPQLPDPNGWDVNATWNKVLADDWKCSETGYVTDIHFWGSWEGEMITGEIPVPVPITAQLSIHLDVPAVVDDDGNVLEHSRPGDLKWLRTFTINPRGPFPGDQGWYDPNDGTFNAFDHNWYWQYNVDIPESDAFWQDVGNTYWLDISVITTADRRWGWKTSLDHWNDDAVVGHLDATGEPIGDWEELYDPSILPPNIPVSLDMAFVITPEPATLAVLAIGGLIMLRSRKLRRNH